MRRKLRTKALTQTRISNVKITTPKCCLYHFLLRMSRNKLKRKIQSQRTILVGGKPLKIISHFAITCGAYVVINFVLSPSSCRITLPTPYRNAQSKDANLTISILYMNLDQAYSVTPGQITDTEQITATTTLQLSNLNKEAPSHRQIRDLVANAVQ